MLSGAIEDVMQLLAKNNFGTPTRPQSICLSYDNAQSSGSNPKGPSCSGDCGLACLYIPHP